MYIGSRSSESPGSRRKFWILLGVTSVLLALVTSVAAVAFFTKPIKRNVYRSMESLGWDRDSARWEGHFINDTPGALVNWGRSVLSGSDLPQLAIDVKFRHLQALRQRRAESIASGIFVKREDDLVPAVIRVEDRAVRVKIRLKGDAVDGQFDDDGWSFRVQTRGGDHLFGMRRFNLHPPFARDFQTEPLFLQHVRHLGVLAPRYMFVKVLLNGENLGVMAIEEHFSKELLESQNRRESVILKIDESRYWAFPDRLDRFASPFGNFHTADLVAFRESRVKRNPKLESDLKTATGLYRAFAEGSMPASQVFDARLMGRFLAAVETWQAWHGASWRNIRFYYNPITGLLEPIAYDAEMGSIGFHTPEPMHGLMFADSTILAEYKAALREIADESTGALPVSEIEEQQEKYLRSLHRQFPFLKAEKIISELRKSAKAAVHRDPTERIRFIANRWNRDDRPLPDLGVDRFRPSDLVLANRVVTGPDSSRTLELRNLVPFDVTVRYEAAAVEGTNDSVAEVRLPPTPIGARPEMVRLPAGKPTSPDSLFVFAEGADVGAWITPKDYYTAAVTRPLPGPSLKAAAALEFLDYDQDSRTLTSRPGTWNVREVISLPEGVTLELTAGTEIRFDPDAALIVRGPTRFMGTADHPIVLGPRRSAERWRGIMVFNSGSRAEWSHVNVSRTSGVAFENWNLTGGVTIYEGDVLITDSWFADNAAEDALNLVRTTFVVNRTQVSGAASDAIDFDFGRGRVIGGSFEDIGFAGGGDGLDFSGARATVSNTTFSRVADKAISVGEGSQVHTENVTIESVGVAAVSKDGSYLRISESSLSDARFAALMAYTKKPEYGGAVLEAVGLAINSANPLFNVQTGSLLRIDGQAQTTADFDVDALYQTIMRKRR